MAKIVGTIGPSPPPQFNVEVSSFRFGEATQRCTGGGGGIISSSYMNSSVWEWSTEFVVSILSMIVDYEAAFQLILARIVGQPTNQSNSRVGLTAAGDRGERWEVRGERGGYLHVGLVLGRDVGLLLAVRLEFGLQLLQRFLNRGLRNHQNDITPGPGSSKLDLPNPGLSRSLPASLFVYLSIWDGFSTKTAALWSWKPEERPWSFFA